MTGNIAVLSKYALNAYPKNLILELHDLYKNETDEVKNQIATIENPEQHILAVIESFEKHIDQQIIKERFQNLKTFNEISMILNTTLSNTVRLFKRVMATTKRLYMAKIISEQSIKIPLTKQDIVVLNLTTRSYNCLHRHNINTIEDLLKYTEIELLNSVKRFGTGSLNEIKEKLAMHGLTMTKQT